MAKAAFRVEDGIIPGSHNTMDFGHDNNRFRHAYFEGNIDVDGNTLLNNLTANGTVSLPNFSGGGGGGGDVTKAEAIAFAIALG